MKLAVISDIHSNLYALMNVLNDIDDKKADLIICLGDLVGYGPHPNETISLIKRRKILCIKGNYDMAVVNNSFDYIRDTPTNIFSLNWNQEELRAQNKYFLETLPCSLSLSFSNKTLKLVHGSPNKINEYLYENAENTISVMDNLSDDVLLCAHTHIPSIKEYKNKLLINPGSVGKPKIGTPDSTYCIIDIDNNGKITPQIHQINYDVNKIVKDMEMLNFPSSLIRSLKEGHEN